MNAAVLIAAVLAAQTAERWHVMLDGQSNSAGTNGLPAIHTSTAAGYGLRTDGYSSTGSDWIAPVAVVPLAEVDSWMTNRGETPASCFADVFRRRTGESMIADRRPPGVGFDTLISGTARWNQHLTMRDVASAYAAAEARTYRPAIFLVHGEWDSLNVSGTYPCDGDRYAGCMAEHQVQKEAALGAGRAVPLVAAQLGCWNQDGQSRSDVALSQLDAARGNAKILLVASYALPRAGGGLNIHGTATGHCTLGAAAGAALAQWALTGTYRPAAIEPASILGRGDAVEFSIAGGDPAACVSADTARMPAQKHHGLIYADPANPSTAIASVVFLGCRTMRANLTGPATLTGRLAYGATATTGQGCGPDRPAAPASNPYPGGNLVLGDYDDAAAPSAVDARAWILVSDDPIAGLWRCE